MLTISEIVLMIAAIDVVAGGSHFVRIADLGAVCGDGLVLIDAAPRTTGGFGNLSAPIHCKGKRHLQTEHGGAGNFDRRWRLGC